MKNHIFTVFAVLALGLGVSSYSLNSYTPSDPIYFSFATTSLNGASDNSKITFYTDDMRLLVPNETITSKFKAKEGKRVGLYFSLPSTTTADDVVTSIKIYQIDTSIIIGNTVSLETLEDIVVSGNDRVSINTTPNPPCVTEKFVNLYVIVNASDIKKHTFTLAHDTSKPGTDKELNFTLIHKANGDISSLEYSSWVSFPLSGFTSELAGKDQIAIDINTRMNGLQTLHLALPKQETK